MKTRKTTKTKKAGRMTDERMDDVMVLLNSWAKLIVALRAARLEAAKVRLHAPKLGPPDACFPPTMRRTDRTVMAGATVSLGELAGVAALVELAAGAALASVDDGSGAWVAGMVSNEIEAA